MEEFINIVKDEKEVNMMSPLTWAYIGDCVYELYIRTQLVNTTNLKPHKLHIESIKYVKAQSQASFLQRIYDDLTDGEEEGIQKIIICQKIVMYKTICILQHLKL